MGHDPRRQHRDRDAHLLGADEPARGFDPEDTAILDPHSGDFAVLDQVDAPNVDRARIAPGYRVMPHRAAPPLRQRALDRKAGIVEVAPGIDRADLLPVQKLRIRTVQDHRVAAPGDGVALRVGVDQVHDPALADHGVVVQVLLKPLPEFQRKFVEGFVPVQKVVRADDCGVAADIAATKTALLKDRDPLLTELLGQITGRRQPMPADDDDDDVVAGLRGRVAPASPPFSPWVSGGRSRVGQPVQPRPAAMQFMVCISGRFARVPVSLRDRRSSAT